MKKLLIILLLFSFSKLYCDDFSRYEKVNKPMGKSRGVVLYLQMDEGTGSTVFDVAGNTVPITMHGGIDTTGWVTGKFRWGLNFDGSNDYVEISTTTNLNITGAVSMMAWIYIDISATSSGFIIEKSKTATSGSYQYCIFWSFSSKQIQCWLNEAQRGSSTTNSIIAGKWYHVVVVYDMQNVKYYIDGKLNATSAAFTDALAGAGSCVEVGKRRQTSTLIFKGKMDEVMIHNVALTAQEVSYSYKKSVKKFR